MDKCINAQLKMYDTLYDEDRVKFADKFCKSDGFCITREEHASIWSFHCLKAGN